MKLEKRSEDTMQELVASVAGPREWGDTRQSWIGRAARRAGISYRQAKSIFYGEITDPEHKAVRAMRKAAGRDEAKRLADQFETVANSLNVRDADFHSSDVAALISAARALRGLAGTGTNET